MLRRLPLVTVLLVALALGFAGLIVKELTTVPRAPVTRPQPAASVGTTPGAPPPAPGSTAAPNYTVVASRNLFSPTRSEAPPAPPTPPPPPPVLPKPNLFGVILIEGTPVAYLEDPVSKRVARYRVGDSVAGGTVKSIESDTVMLLRPEGQVTVRLHDPTRPRAAMPTNPNAPGVHTPPIPTANPTLGGIPPHTLGGIPPQVNNPEGRPTITQPRRPLAPGPFGRPPQPTDATPPQ
jgi:hypothetical protein